MKTEPIHQVLLGLVGVSLLATGCVVRERVAYSSPPAYGDQTVVGTEIYATEAPPAPITEVVTESPDPTFVWIGGVWVWGGGSWRWETGHWARPPHLGARWVPHRYVMRGGRHVWVRGGWR